MHKFTKKWVFKSEIPEHFVNIFNFLLYNVRTVGDMLGIKVVDLKTTAFWPMFIIYMHNCLSFMLGDFDKYILVHVYK